MDCHRKVIIVHTTTPFRHWNQDRKRPEGGGEAEAEAENRNHVNESVKGHNHENQDTTPLNSWAATSHYFVIDIAVFPCDTTRHNATPP